MKVFDKIYIAKYKNVSTLNELAMEMGTSKSKIKEVIEELKNTRRDKIYVNIPDEEWEKLENKSEEYVLRKYNVPIKTYEQIFKELIDLFTPPKVKFPIFDEFNWQLKRLKDTVIVDEEWKTIKDFHYSISNYGRFRNDKSGKLKSPRYHRWILQVDIYENGKRYTCDVARMVANYFIREVNENERVRYIDGDRRNNYYKNLEIISK